MELTKEQIEAFDRDGVICLRHVLSADDINGLRRAVSEQMASLGKSATGYDFEHIARQLWSAQPLEQGAASRFDLARFRRLVAADPDSRPLLEDELADGEGGFFYDVAAWKRDRGVRRVAFDSVLPSISAQLMGAEYVNFWEDTTFVKAPGTRQKTAFHQDLSYFQIDGDQCLIVWIPLDPSGPANGVTEYVRGSHRWGEVFAPNVFVTQAPLAGATDKRCPDIDGDRDAYDIVRFDVEPGDVIIHHVLTVHGAGGNMSDTWRRAVSFRYCGNSVRYFDRPGAIQQVGVARDLQTGDRLLSADYPVVWPKPWPGLKLAELYPEPQSAHFDPAPKTSDAFVLEVVS